MRRIGILVVLGLAAASTACIVEHDNLRDEREPTAYAPPPPPAAEQSYDSEYQAEAPPAPAGANIPSEDVFYGRLDPYGTWTYVGGYGRVWVPAVAYGWRPYYYGRWMLTDWGWTFVSDDPWGWAAYHYGRWNYGVGIGWYWIPGTVWAPAWVTWRYGGGYAAWCPMGPSGVYFGYTHPAWVAVREEHFTRPIPRAAIPPRQAAGIIPTAQPLSGAYAQPTRRSFGPPVASVQRAVGQPIPRAQANQVVGHPRASAGPGAPRASGAGEPIRSPQARPRAGSGGDVPRASPGTAPRPYGGPVGRPRTEGAPSSRPAPAPRGGDAAPAPRSGGQAAPAPAAPPAQSSPPKSSGHPHAKSQ